MRVTILGHSALYIEAGGEVGGDSAGVSILVDPWLLGSCYWRSWWHYPPSLGPDPRWLSPDYVYITHHHFDHFHYPSIRKLDKNAHVLVPKVGVDFMAGELHELGFARVSELPHGHIRSLGPGLRVASYQYGFDDSVFVVADGDDVLVDINDAKIRGRALGQICRAFGRPSLMLKSHSWAALYPKAYEADAPEDLELISRESFCEDFLGAARQLRPRYAIPFGSSIGFLHPAAFELNADAVTPEEVAEVFRHSDCATQTECVTLEPGDSWDGATGFERQETDWASNREVKLKELAADARAAIDRSAAQEATRCPSFDDFSAYLQRFMRELPPFVARVLLPRPVVFEVSGEREPGPHPRPYWVVDFGRAEVRREREEPAERASLVRAPTGVLDDALSKHILHYLIGCMRVRVHLKPGGVDTDLAFWGLLALWELGYLPLRRMLRPRFAVVAWRRRREIMDLLAALRGGGSLFRRMSSGLATLRDAPGGP